MYNVQDNIYVCYNKHNYKSSLKYSARNMFISQHHNTL